MWYNRLDEYLIKEGYKSNVISPCVFIKRSISSFIIIAVYVDDLNTIRSPKEIEKTGKLLKNEFKMKDFSVIKLCLGLQIEHLHNGIFIHQSNYIKKMLKHFNMNKTHPLNTPMFVRSLDVKKYPYWP
jgi:Reverse transcriptase (RNA-dependent DNA polymerase)